jgi:hypothetical protein
MIVIRTVDGHEIDGDENAVELIAGPYPHDVGPHTYVYGFTQTALLTAERPEALVARLSVKEPLAKLTRPDRSCVWVKGAAVTSVRAPLPIEEQGPGEVNAVLEVGSHHQSVREDLPRVRRIINAHGGNI